MSDELSTSVITDDRPAQVHPMAVVDPRAELAHGVVIGPGAVIGPEVSIGANTWIGPHVVLDGLLRICSEFNLCPRNYTNYPEQSAYTCTPGEFYPAAGIFDFNHANVNTGLVLKPMRSRQGQRDA